MTVARKMESQSEDTFKALWIILVRVYVRSRNAGENCYLQNTRHDLHNVCTRDRETALRSAWSYGRFRQLCARTSQNKLRSNYHYPQTTRAINTRCRLQRRLATCRT